MKRLLLCVFGLLIQAVFPAAAQIAPVSSPTGPVMAGPYIVIDAASGRVFQRLIGRGEELREREYHENKRGFH